MVRILFIILISCPASYAQTLMRNQQAAVHPAGFWENNGQVKNQNGEERSDILYLFTAPSMQVHVKNNGWSYQICRWAMDTMKLLPHLRNGPAVPDSLGIHRIDISWKNGGNFKTISAFNTSPDVNNYYLGNESFIGVKRFAGVNLNGLYNDVNIIARTRYSGDFEYDVEIPAGFDLSQLRMQVQGADSIYINDKNELILATPLGDITERIPQSWQNTDKGRKMLNVLWKTNGEEVWFELPENYDAKWPLVIDPWATYYGAGQDFGEDVATDASNNVYATGYTGSSTLIATTGTFQSTINNINTADVFIVRFNSTGVCTWGTYYGGNDNESYARIDSRGGNLVCTFTTASTGMASSGTYLTSLPGFTNCLLARFNPANGQRIWATYFGGSISDVPSGVALDNSNNIYMAGTATSANGIATTGAFKTTISGSSDGFLTKFNINGTLQWSTYIGGNQDDAINDVAVDNANLPVVVGYTNSNGIATAGTHQTTKRASNDGFIAKFNANGTRIWTTYYGGADSDNLQAVACDQSQRTYVAGKTYSTQFIATTGAFKTSFSSGGNGSGVLARFSSTGTLDYGTYYGGEGDDYVYGIKVDGSGNIYCSGYTSSTTGIATAGAHKTTLAAGRLNNYDVFIGKFSPAGVRLWGTYYGGSNFDVGFGMALDGAANVIVTGYTASNSNIATGGSHQNSFQTSGGTTCFVAHFNSSGVLPVTWLSVSASLIPNNKVAVQWGTSTETDNDFFTVEHSLDGVNFSPLVQITGAGNSSTVKSYSWLHGAPSAGNNYYRIKQTDYNGQFDYSKTVSAKTEGGNADRLWISGNQKQYVIHSSSINQIALQQLINASGMPISVMVTPASDGLQLNMQDIPSGIYIALIEQNGIIKPLRFIH